MPKKIKSQQNLQLKWFLKTWFIFVVSFVFILSGVIPIALIAAAILIFFQSKALKRSQEVYERSNLTKSEIMERESYSKSLEEKITTKEKIFESNRDEYIARVEGDIRKGNEDAIVEAQNKAKEIVAASQKDLQVILKSVEKYTSENQELENENQKLNRQTHTQINKIKRAKVEALGIKNLIDSFPRSINLQVLEEEVGKYTSHYDSESILHTFVELDLHYKDSKELRKKMSSRKRELKKLLESYTERYTTKGNQTIYQLMVIGLQAELQNILYSLTATKLDEGLEHVRELIRKYLAISANGNQSILPTITRFLAEIEPLFLEMVEIEYHYYAKRELEKEEQRAIREQMRQDAAERKALKEQQQKIEQEEEKFNIELKRNRELLENEVDAGMIATLIAKISELEQQQKSLAEEKEEIIKRANGKAGYVYVISNLGSFGEDVFKIGMTRRMDPFDRIDELSSASVPFIFDVHAMIFSRDAVDLENKLHEALTEKRVNKINLRKEFFRTTVDELQQLVEDTDATVEFKRTLLAKEYIDTLEMEKVKQLA